MQGTSRAVAPLTQSAPLAPRLGAFGDYTLEERLAVGGRAELFAARRRDAGHGATRVAVKRLLPALLDAGEAQGLTDEATIHGLLRHPNIVTFLGSGEVGDEPYLTLELVEGVDLGRLTRVLRQQGRTLPVSLAVFIARSIALALDALHGADGGTGRPLDIVHGDVTPANLLLGRQGEVKLGDFGAARSRVLRTSEAGLQGKLGYVAPEQLLGEPVDAKADQFALAVVLGELLIGGRVYPGDGELARLLAMRDGNFEPLLRASETLPPGLGEVCARALSPDPRARYRTCRELSHALRPFISADDQGSVLGAWVRWAEALRCSGQFRGTPTAGGLPNAVPSESGERPSTPPRTTARLSGPAEPTLSVSLGEGGALELLADWRRARETGLALFERPGPFGGVHRTEVYLSHGSVIHVGCADFGPRLGQYLVRSQLLGADELARVVDATLTTGQSLTAVLLDRHAVPASDLERALRILTRDRAAACAGWTEGRVRFYRDAEPEEPAATVELDLAGVMMAAVPYIAQGNPRKLLPGDEVTLRVGARTAALVDPIERGRAPAMLLKLAGLAARRATVGESLAGITRRDAQSLGLAPAQAAAAIATARALGWIAY